MPQSCYIEPPRISIKKKLPELNISRIDEAVSALPYIYSAWALLKMIGGTVSTNSGIKPSNESSISDVIVSYVLKTDNSFIIKCIWA